MRWFSLTRLPIIALTAVLCAAPAAAEKRGVRVEGKEVAQYLAEQTGKAYAVVIGIDAYQKIGSLRYAVADAKAVAQTLKQRGYEVRNSTTSGPRNGPSKANCGPCG